MNQCAAGRRVNMLCYIFLIGLVLPPFTLTRDATKENETAIICDNPEVIKAGDIFFESLNKYAMRSSDEKMPLSILVRPIFEYFKVANKSCYKDPSGIVRDAIEFIKLVQYSVRHGEFQDFVNNSGVECIAAVRSKISDCMKNEFATVPVDDPKKRNDTRKYENLWKMTGLPINKKKCKATERVKFCTQKAMRDEGYHHCKYENNNVLYVGSLFNYVLERCSRLVPNWRELNQEQFNREIEQNTSESTRTTHALLGVFVTLAMLAMLYLCIRDCRSPRGYWRAINDRMSMSIMNRGV